MRKFLENSKARLQEVKATPMDISTGKLATGPGGWPGAFAAIGNGTIPARSVNWNETCQGCCRSSPHPGRCGRSYEPPTPSSVASLPSGAAPGPWSALNVQSVDQIIYSIFQRFNLEWKHRTLNQITRSLTSPNT